MSKPAPSSRSLRRLRDIQGIAALESRALFDPSIRSYSGGWFDEQIEQLSSKLFGFTLDELELDTADEKHLAVISAAHAPMGEELQRFAALGWDVADEHGRPLLILPHFAFQLAAAALGVMGHLPSQDVSAEDWGAAMAAEAARFRPGKSPPRG